MAHQRFLQFDELRTNFITEPEAQALLEEASPLLWQSITYTWDDFQVSRRDDPRFRSFSEGDAAWWLHGQIKQVAQQLADDCPELGITAHTTRDNQFYLSLRGELILVFKKLVRVYSRKQMCDVLVRSNYPTKHNCDFWAQRRESGLDAPRLVIGYEPIKAMTETRVHVGYPRTKGHRFDWVYEMPNQVETAKKLFNLSIARDSERMSENRGFTVVPRNSRADKRGAV